MDYLREINAFERWLETNYLPCSSQLLWYRLMALCNRAGWPEWVAVDNQRLMAMIQSKREATLISVRDKLIEAGRIEYRKGKKGYPNQYRICTFKNVVQSVVETEVNSVVQSVVETVAQTADIPTYTTYPSDTPYTPETKTKTKTSPGTRARASDTSAQLDACELSPDLRERVEDWLRYKSEKGKGYKPTGLKALLTTIQHQAATHGVTAVVECIGESMSNGWQGIIWDRIKPAGGRDTTPTGTTNPFARMAMEERRKAANDQA